MRLLIPFACAEAPECRARLPALRLPHLDALLQRLVPVHADLGATDSLSPPHERARARLAGLPTLPDGCLPWAAQEARTRGLGAHGDGWAWIWPAHWEVGTQQVNMADPGALGLDATEAGALMATMQPYFAEDGLELHPALPHRWLCRARMFQALPTAALDRAVGTDLQAWMPAVPALRRLQNEMQMLLYTHPVNDARSAAGLRTVNSFWVSGSGAWPQNRATDAGNDIHAVDTLRDAALQGDWDTWAGRWAEVDATACRHMLEDLPRTPDSELVLCGERGALHLAPAPRSWWQALRRRWRPARLADLQDRL